MNGDSASSNVLSYVGKLGEINLDWTSQSVNIEVVCTVSRNSVCNVCIFLLNINWSMSEGE